MLCSAWYGSRLACDQACARLSRALIPGQRDEEFMWGRGINGTSVAVGAGAGEGAAVVQTQE